MKSALAELRWLSHRTADICHSYSVCVETDQTLEKANHWWPVLTHIKTHTYTWLTFCHAMPVMKPLQSVCKDTNLTLTGPELGQPRWGPSSKLDYKRFVALGPGSKCCTYLTCDWLGMGPLWSPPAVAISDPFTSNKFDPEPSPNWVVLLYAALQTIWSNLCKFLRLPLAHHVF